MLNINGIINRLALSKAYILNSKKRIFSSDTSVSEFSDEPWPEKNVHFLELLMYALLKAILELLLLDKNTWGGSVLVV